MSGADAAALSPRADYYRAFHKNLTPQQKALRRQRDTLCKKARRAAQRASDDPAMRRRLAAQREKSSQRMRDARSSRDPSELAARRERDRKRKHAARLAARDAADEALALRHRDGPQAGAKAALLVLNDRPAEAQWCPTRPAEPLRLPTAAATDPAWARFNAHRFASSVVAVAEPLLAQETATALSQHVGGVWTVHSTRAAAYEVRGPAGLSLMQLAEAEAAVRVADTAHAAHARVPVELRCATVWVDVPGGVLQQVYMPLELALALISSVMTSRGAKSLMGVIDGWTQEYNSKHGLKSVSISTVSDDLWAHTAMLPAPPAKPIQLVAVHLVEFWLERASVQRSCPGRLVLCSHAQLIQMLCSSRIHAQGRRAVDKTPSKSHKPEHRTGRLAGVEGGVVQQLWDYLLHTAEWRTIGVGRMQKRVEIWKQHHMMAADYAGCTLSRSWVNDTLKALRRSLDVYPTPPLCTATTGFVRTVDGKITIQASRYPSACLLVKQPPESRRATTADQTAADMEQFLKNRHVQAMEDLQKVCQHGMVPTPPGTLFCSREACTLSVKTAGSTCDLCTELERDKPSRDLRQHEAAQAFVESESHDNSVQAAQSIQDLRDSGFEPLEQLRVLPGECHYGFPPPPLLPCRFA